MCILFSSGPKSVLHVQWRFCPKLCTLQNSFKATLTLNKDHYKKQWTHPKITRIFGSLKEIIQTLDLLTHSSINQRLSIPANNKSFFFQNFSNIQSHNIKNHFQNSHPTNSQTILEIHTQTYNNITIITTQAVSFFEDVEKHSLIFET